MSDLKIGARIRQLREELKLTQEELSERANIANRALQRLEAGQNSPNLGTLEAVARGLGVPISKIFSLAEGGRMPTDMLGAKGAESALRQEQKSARVRSEAQYAVDNFEASKGKFEHPPFDRDPNPSGAPLTREDILQTIEQGIAQLAPSKVSSPAANYESLSENQRELISLIKLLPEDRVIDILGGVRQLLPDELKNRARSSQ